MNIDPVAAVIRQGRPVCITARAMDLIRQWQAEQEMEPGA